MEAKWELKILNLVGKSFRLVQFSDHLRNVFLFDTSFSKLIKFLINDLKWKWKILYVQKWFIRDESSTITFWIFFSCSSCSAVRFSDSAKNCFRSSILCRSRSWICRLSNAACWPNSAPFSRRSAFSFSISRCCSRKIRSNSCLSRCARQYCYPLYKYILITTWYFDCNGDNSNE